MSKRYMTKAEKEKLIEETLLDDVSFNRLMSFFRDGFKSFEEKADLYNGYFHADIPLHPIVDEHFAMFFANMDISYWLIKRILSERRLIKEQLAKYNHLPVETIVSIFLPKTKFGTSFFFGYSSYDIMEKIVTTKGGIEVTDPEFARRLTSFVICWIANKYVEIQEETDLSVNEGILSILYKNLIKEY